MPFPGCAGSRSDDCCVGTDADTTAFGAASIVEAPWSVYTEDVINSVADYSDAAIVVLSRIGGEGADSYFDHALADGKNYLALNDTEREMMENIKAMKDAGTIKKIVVLVNTSNALQLDFLKANGIEVLDNEKAIIEKDGQEINFAKLEDK